MNANRYRNQRPVLTRRQFLEAGSSAVTATVLGPATSFAAENRPAGQGAITLAISGKMRYAILISPQAREAETFAAQELRKCRTPRRHCEPR